MLRYQQQYPFFDPKKVNESIRFVNLSDEAIEGGLERVLERIIREVEESGAGIVVVDSFRSLVGAFAGAASYPGVHSFVQRLALHLTTWQATSFLVGEYQDRDRSTNAVFTIADTVIWLFQAPYNNSIVRKVQIVKVRGQAQLPGLHTFRMTGGGLQVFPRLSLAVNEDERATPAGRASTGVAGLNEMMGGGIPTGDSALVAGPSGSGKSVLATQFIAEGGRQGEPGVLVVFEEHPKEYLHRADGLGFKLQQMVDDRMLEALYLRPLDLSPDETSTRSGRPSNGLGQNAWSSIPCRLRSCPGADFPGGLSRVALPAGGDAHRRRHHRAHYHGDHAGPGRASVYAERHLVPRGRSHFAPVRRGR
jgi:circadian clock protein KaiC